MAAMPGPEVETDSARRQRYAKLLADGVGALFDAPRPDCPLCGQRELVVALETEDLLQYKPGRFALSRCRDCGHLFQNPMLSARGLEFYYADFYEGQGEASVFQRFASQHRLDRARVHSLPRRPAPARWLDVGAGHGHFCRQARRRWPKARFDALDRNPALRQARERGWIDRHLDEPLLELATRKPGAYDVISMFHYLEHSCDPRAEIGAAAALLRPGGQLLIECPDPDSLLGKLLGRFWLSWFQPQHLHLLNLPGLRRLLDEHQLELQRVWRAEAHRPEDFEAAVKLALGWLAPKQDQPWLDESQRVDADKRAWLGVAGIPALLGAAAADRLLAPLLRRVGGSNTFRVLARRVEG